jgi:hypothetical protein
MDDYEKRHRRILDTIDAVFSDGKIDPTSHAMTDAIRAIVPHATEWEIDEALDLRITQSKSEACAGPRED